MGLLKGFGIAAILLTTAAIGAAMYGASLWANATRNLLARLEAVRLPPALARYDAREILDLPAPVQRYFRLALKDGQPFVAAASIEHVGTFNMSEASDRWRPFTSRQRVVTQRPGFLWNARIQMTRALPVYVHDAYVAESGLLRAAIFGLIQVADMDDTPELAQGELMRFLAEAVWYPTSLLPSQGVIWTGLDDHSAEAALRDGNTRVTLTFHFHPSGMIDTVRAAARARSVNGQLVSQPWQGRFWNYAERHGMRVPVEGEVAWLLPEGPKPYWRGELTTLTYEFAQ